MILKEKKTILSKLGEILRLLGNNDGWPGYEVGINLDEFNDLNELVKTVHIYNGWFKEEEVRRSFRGISSWLKEANLEDWLSNYSFQETSSKNVAIIMAGNIPLVGFHDFISVFLSGHKCIVKMSSDDKHLLPALIKTMSLFDQRISDWIELSDAQIKNFDAVIATGSDNSSRYFESYFGKHPHIIRKNRNSIAIINGTESKEELSKLGEDIFNYYGLGCRNISQIWIPKEFDLDRFFEAIFEYGEVVQHNKYANNYDYNKAVYLMNQENLLDNGFLLLKEDASLHSPLGMLHYVRYDKQSQIDAFLEENKDEIQVVIGDSYLPLGNSQCPGLSDYADGVDTMAFLQNL